MTVVSKDMFSYCRELSEIKTVTDKINILPKQIERIGESAFKLCQSLPSLTISENLKSLGNQTFADWTNSQTIYFDLFNVPNEWDTPNIRGEAQVKGSGVTVVYEKYSDLTSHTIDKKAQNNRFKIPKSKDGAQFQGWAYRSDEIFVLITDNAGNQIKDISPYVSDGELVLEASWKYDRYAIDYETYGGFIAFLIFPVFIWEFELASGIVWYLLFSICLTVCLLWFLKNLQFAIIDTNGLIIKRLFFTIIKLKWTDIYSIENKSLITHDSRGAVVFQWLIIHSQKKDDDPKRGGLNKKCKSPWQIIATKKI